MSLLDDVAATYANIMAERDLDKLLEFWYAYQDVRRAVGELNEDLETHIYDLMPDKEHRVDRVGLVTRYRPASKVYDDEEITRRLRRCATDPETGEVDEGVALALVKKAAKISYWRQKDLPFPLDDELVEKKFGAKKIRRED